MRATTHLDKGNQGDGPSPVDSWAWLYPELRALVNGWIVPALVGLGAALLVGFALASLLGHHEPGTVSWHNVTAVLAGLVVAAYVFGRGCRSAARESGGDDRIRTGE